MEIASVQNPVTEWAEAHDWLVRRVAYLGRRNCPDLFLFRDGRVVIFECKAWKKEPNIGQRREIKRLREAGMEVHVIDRASDGIEILRRYD